MEMSTSERPELPRETDPVKECRGDQDVGGAPQEFRPNEPNPTRDPVGPQLSNKSAFETYVGGAGI
jgi:hypothetical protein